MEPPKILVVDDDPFLCKLYELFLHEEGYETVTAVNGEDALNALDRENPDLVILDVMMPILDGMQVAKLMRENPRTENIPILLVSASPLLPSWANSVRAESQMSKPFDLDRFLLEIRRLMTLKN